MKRIILSMFRMKPHLKTEKKGCLYEQSMSQFFTPLFVNIYQDIYVYAIPIASNHGNFIRSNYSASCFHLLEYMKRNGYNTLTLYFDDDLYPRLPRTGSQRSRRNTIDLNTRTCFNRPRSFQSGCRRVLENNSTRAPILLSNCHFSQISEQDYHEHYTQSDTGYPVQQSSTETLDYRDIHSDRNNYRYLSERSNQVTNGTLSHANKAADSLYIDKSGGSPCKATPDEQEKRKTECFENQTVDRQSNVKGKISENELSDTDNTKSRRNAKKGNVNDKSPSDVIVESDYLDGSQGSKCPVQLPLVNKNKSKTSEVFPVPTQYERPNDQIQSNCNIQENNTQRNNGEINRNTDLTYGQHDAIINQLVEQGYSRPRIISAINYLTQNRGNTTVTAQDLIYVMEVAMSPEI